MKVDVLKGQLELVALASLRDGPRHGYAIIKELRERSGGDFDVLEGTLYPALHRLERTGLVTSRWATAAGRRRRVYELTRKGTKALAEQESEWRSFVRRLDDVLGGTA
ncbi:MAG TPA: helix-turn-helix transcriptional regulator [Gaiellaceae bacterium]